MKILIAALCLFCLTASAQARHCCRVKCCPQPCVAKPVTVTKTVEKSKDTCGNRCKKTTVTKK